MSAEPTPDANPGSPEPVDRQAEASVVDGRTLWRALRLPIALVVAALTYHFIVHVPHGQYYPRPDTKASSGKKKKRSTRERKVFESEKVDPQFVAALEPVLERAYELGFDAANSGAATPEITEVEMECRTMRCMLRVCGTKIGVNMTLRGVNRVRYRSTRLWRVFERGERKPQVEGNHVCVETTVRFVVQDPTIDDLRAPT
jgi:hypothetical protein